MSIVLDELREKFEDNDRVHAIHDTSMNGGRIDALQVDARWNDMPFTLMYDLFHPNGEFIGDVVPYQFAAGIRHDQADDPVAVPVLILVEAGTEVTDELKSMEVSPRA